MARSIHSGRIFAAILLFAAPAILAQNAPTENKNPAPCSATPEPQPCSAAPDAGKTSPAEKFPFPGEQGSPQSSSPGISGAPEAPQNGAPAPPASAKPDAAKQFPFPGEDSNASSPEAPKVSGSSSSSSSSGDSDADSSATPDPNSGAPGLADKGSEGTNSATPGRHILHRVNPVATKLQSPDEREAEDLDVAHFYMDSGDLRGAYLRSQDAVKIMPDDPEAHFALAEIALKLNKRDEAIAEYSACLKLNPTDKQAKASRKALQKLKP